MHRSVSRSVATVLGAFVACTARADDVALPAEFKPFLSTHCVDCHEGARAKGGLDLGAALEKGAMSESVLRVLRARLVKRDMPPVDEDTDEATEETDRPRDDEYAAAIALIDAHVAPSAREVALVRRLNRAQYAFALRDVVESDLDVRELLPADEIGEGFDTTGDTLVLPALLVEKYFDAAERIARRCVPPDSLEQRHRFSAEKLARRGQGSVNDGAAWLSTTGDLSAESTDLAAGEYRVEIEACAQQAGDEVARMAIVVDGTVVSTVDVPQDASAPGTFTAAISLAAGEHRVSARFLNDFYAPNEPQRDRRDRNLGVVSIALIGPLGETAPTAFETRATLLAGEGIALARLRRVASLIGEELFRRALPKTESDALSATAREAAGKDAAWNDQLRALLTALLVDPRFLLRVEMPCAKGESSRALTSDELASRLAFFLWSSVPDAELRRAAKADELHDDAKLRAQVQRMLIDQRARSLSTRFATQWLGIDALENKQVDPLLFPNVDAALLVSMRNETEQLFDDVARGALPVRALLTARTTHADAQLARHYGIERGSGERTDIDAARASGVLGHASVLVATSNPTRTSPVKRGKWVLEALLDDAPPPPPPGVPQLPENGTSGAAQSMREMMALHRANPDCASCHVRMDAIGLAFEKLDVDGTLRRAEHGVAIDDSSVLVDGTTLAGTKGVEDLLAKDARFERSLTRHLLVYALGRGTADADDPLVDALAQHLRRDGSFAGLVQGIVTSDAFRVRRDLRKSPSP